MSNQLPNGWHIIHSPEGELLGYLDEKGIMRKHLPQEEALRKIAELENKIEELQRRKHRVLTFYKVGAFPRDFTFSAKKGETILISTSGSGWALSGWSLCSLE